MSQVVKSTGTGGKELINESYDLQVHTIFECLFGFTEFTKNYWHERKLDNIKLTEWTPVSKFSKCAERTMDYKHTLAGVVSLTSREKQRILVNNPEEHIVVEVLRSTTGVPYGDCFRTILTYNIQKLKEQEQEQDSTTTTTKTRQQSRLSVKVTVSYLNQPNFFIKEIIESKTYSANKEAFDLMARLLSNEREEKYDDVDDDEDEDELMMQPIHNATPSFVNVSGASQKEENNNNKNITSIINDSNDESRSPNKLVASLTKRKSNHIKSKSASSVVALAASSSWANLQSALKNNWQPQNNNNNNNNNNINSNNKEKENSTSVNNGHESNNSSKHSTNLIDEADNSSSSKLNYSNSYNYIWLQILFLASICLICLNGFMFVWLDRAESVLEQRIP